MKPRLLTLASSLCWRIEHFANEAKAVAESIFLPNAFAPTKDSWVQLSPFGDFGNRDAKKNKVIQRFRKEDAEAICNEFNSTPRKILQPLGMPFYVGHPDHPRFKGQPGHSDTGAKGRGKEMAVRHDPDCQVCADFANSGAPCAEHGLFVKMAWNDEGQHLIANEAFHGHSVNWGAVPDGKENGVQIMRPVRVKSAGFTNEPNIPVPPAQLANEAEGEEAAATKTVIPPKLKLIAGFKADEDVTMEQILAALEKIAAKGMPNEADIAVEGLLGMLFLPNDAADGDGAGAEVPPWVHEALGTKPEDGKDAVKAALQDKVTKASHMDRVKKTGDEMRKAQDRHYKARNEMEQALANEKTARTTAETALANERRARATLIVDGAVKAGRVIIGKKDESIELLCTAGDKFDQVAQELANIKVTIKTTAKSTSLAGKQSEGVNGMSQRSAKWETLMAKRAQDLPNESYEDRYAAVAASSEGAQLFAQMTRPEAEDKKD